jgi:S1-C subfamily serine protease
MATRLNWLRAAVLGTNDGIVSTAGLVVGVAGATSSRTAILTADTVTSIAAQTVVDAAGQPAGVGIVRVAPGGAAAKAGIQPGDIIVDLAGQPVPSMAALQSVLAAHKPGDRVQARVSRDGAESTVLVTLGSLTS